MKNLLKNSIILTIFTIILLVIPKDSNAAGLAVSVNNKNPEVGTSINLTIGNGIGGRVKIVSSNPNVISVPSSEFVDYNSKTISLNAKSAGTTTITVTAVDVVTTEENPKEVTGSSSVTVTVKEKQVPVQTPQEQTPPQKNNGENSKPNASTKTPASNKNNTDKTKTQNVEETIIEEEATPQFGMNSLLIKAVKENGENEEIEYTPTFNIDVYEYSCNVSSDVQDVNVITEAGEYNEFVKIEKPENLNAGENIIKINMSKDDKNITYIIKVFKDEKVEEIKEPEQAKDSEKLIIFTIPQFVTILLAVCIIEGVLLKMPWKKIIYTRKNKFNK